MFLTVILRVPINYLASIYNNINASDVTDVNVKEPILAHLVVFLGKTFYGCIQP